MLKYMFLLVSFFLLQSDAMEELSWSEHYKLSWKDFKGEPNKDTDAVAVTASGITFSYSINKYKRTQKVQGFKTLVKAFFYPEHSWCKSDEVDIHVLGHEQLHFDITELHARLFRQRIANIKLHEDIAQTLQDMHVKIEADLMAMQNAYDTESEYSIDVQGQEKWQDSITKRLKSVSQFKSKG